jgi:hypothetical protein
LSCYFLSIILVDAACVDIETKPPKSNHRQILGPAKGASSP